MDRAEPSTAVVILAGGRASRLPGKLELDAGGVPLVVRVYRNVRDIGPVYVSAGHPFAAAIDSALTCPVILDRRPHGGPLAAVCTAFERVRERRIFLVAGDAPFVDSAVAAELASHWDPGVQAVVPENAEGILEPLCALYDRAAMLAAASEILRAGSGGVAAAVERLVARRVHLSNERVFANVNTPADRQSLLQT